MSVGSAFRIAIVCPVCNEVRYRSVRAFEPGERPTPADFAPEPGVPAPDNFDTIPICFQCQAAMEPRVDTEESVVEKSVGGSEAVSRPAVNREARVRSLPSQPIQVLFQPSPGENILQTKDTTEGLIVVTNQRILRVRF